MRTERSTLNYVVVTAARNEAGNVPRLAEALRTQVVLPSRWIIVENGSSDETLMIARALEAAESWIEVIELDDPGETERGAPIVRAFEAGVATLRPAPDVVVNVDADVSMDEGYFKELLAEFEGDSTLGIASGTAYELVKGEWAPPRFVTGGTVWGATRAYRWECLEDVLPLERRHGWDGMDQLRARSRGWTTRTLTGLPFRHHRPEGGRERSPWTHWRTCGESSYYMGYRPWYLVLRSLHQARRDPAALGMIWGFASSTLKRSPRWADQRGRAVLRKDQSLRNLASRKREAMGEQRMGPGRGPYP